LKGNGETIVSPMRSTRTLPAGRQALGSWEADEGGRREILRGTTKQKLPQGGSFCFSLTTTFSTSESFSSLLV
jgi:hypothetical protein